MRFELQKSLDSAEFLSDFLKQTKFEAKHPMGMVAQSNLEQIISLIFIGRHAEMKDLLRIRCAWLDQALPTGGPSALHTSHMYRARALGAWLEAGDPAESLWEKAGEFHRLARTTPKAPWTKNDIIFGIDDDLAYAVQSAGLGQSNAIWDAAIVDYESYLAPKMPSLTNLRTSREYGYALLLGLSRGTFDLTDLQKAGRKLLRRKLDRDWVGRGQYNRSAMWLKIIHWDLDRRINGTAATITPIEALLKIWDDMPQDCGRPTGI